MDFTAFVELLSVNVEAVLALAGTLALGVFLGVQALKVFGVLTEAVWTGRAAMIIAFVEGVLAVLAYVLPAFLPFGLIIYAVYLAAISAGLGYEYLAKPIISRVFPDAAIRTSDLADE